MNRDVTKRLQAHISKAVEEFASANALPLKLVKNNAKFGMDGISLRIEVANSDPKIVADSFDTNARLVGLTPEHRGAEFVSGGGERYKVIEVESHRPKFQVIAERLSDKKKFLFTAADVKARCGASLTRSNTVVPAKIADNAVTSKPSMTTPGAGSW